MARNYGAPLLVSAQRLQIAWRSWPHAFQYTLLLSGGAAMVLWLAAGLSTRATLDPLHPIYSVAMARAALSRAPQLWLNRPLRLRAILASACELDIYPASNTCRSFQPAMFDADATAGATPFPVVLGRQGTGMAFLRRLPLVSRMVPAPQLLQWGTAAVYQVQLRAGTSRYCHAPACYEALLLDAAPGAP